jgi:hypothetical protein
LILEYIQSAIEIKTFLTVALLFAVRLFEAGCFLPADLVCSVIVA